MDKSKGSCYNMAGDIVLESTIIDNIVLDLKKNSKIRSDQTVVKFKQFLKTFLKHFNISVDDLYFRRTSVSIKKEDIDLFIIKKSKSYIFFLGFVLRTYCNHEIKPFEEIKRVKDETSEKILVENDFKSIVKKEKGTEYLTNKELEKIYDGTVMVDEYRILFLMFITTGMRAGAFKKCNYEDINFEEEYITTIEKGNVETQYLLNPELIFLLKKNKHFFTLFRNDYRISKVMDFFNKKIEKVCMYPHLLRFTYSRLVLNSLNNTKEVQTLLNHSNLQTTQTHYIKETRLDKTKRMNLPWQKKQANILPYFMEEEHVSKFITEHN